MGMPIPGPGRNRSDIDLDELEKLGSLNCTLDEVASWFGVVPTVIDNRLAEDRLYRHNGKDLTFRQIFQNGKNKGRTTLRRLQMKGAEEGNATMLIWLGKQLLGQRDNLDLQHGGTGPGGSILVDARSAKDALFSDAVRTAARLRAEGTNSGADGGAGSSADVELAGMAREAEPDPADG